ncbi:MAG: ABC transporter ATP-binding protein [Candidatus Sumerlaeaceae bacterium]|jgi:ABC-2 type transport system ATP-binding protein
MVRVENLSKYFGDIKAVDGLSFEVLEGEILGFLGPNGAGKTTAMRILTCYFPPTSGRVTVGGFDVVRDSDEVRRIIGYMPEHVPVYRDMTVQDALDFVAHAKGYRRTARRRFVDAVVEETGLGEVRHRLIGHLSKGYRQRVGLAQALIGDPKVLILDEPTVGLDPRQITEVRRLIKSMAGRRTVILSTHILPEVQMTCSRVVIINQGKIAASGTPQKLTTQMRVGSQLVLKAVAPRTKLRTMLETLAHVKKVSLRERGENEGNGEGFDENRLCEFLVETSTLSPEVNSTIAETIVRRGWQLVELYEVGMTLEEIFLRVIASDAAELETSTTGEGEKTRSTEGRA